jgi:hypothetical protein
MLNKVAFEMAKKAIKEDFGNLDDLPRELGNTFANIYYNFYIHVLNKGVNIDGSPVLIIETIDNDFFMKELFRSSAEYSSQIFSDVMSVPEFVRSIREDLDRHKRPESYQYWIDFILDCLKYKISNAGHKSGIRRKIERRLNMSKVQEIPNLIDLIPS